MGPPEVHERLDDLAKRAITLWAASTTLFTTSASTKTASPSCSNPASFAPSRPTLSSYRLQRRRAKATSNPTPRIFESLLRRAARETHARRAAMALGEEAAESGGVKRRRLA